MIEYKGYIGQVNFDNDASILHGEVLNIQDVITFQGKTVDEIRQAFQESIDDYLDFCAERGEQPNTPFSGIINLPLSQDLYRKVSQVATEAGKGIQSWIIDTIDNVANLQITNPIFA